MPSLKSRLFDLARDFFDFLIDLVMLLYILEFLRIPKPVLALLIFQNFELEKLPFWSIYQLLDQQMDFQHPANSLKDLAYQACFVLIFDQQAFEICNQQVESLLQDA